MKTNKGQTSFLENLNDGEYETVLAATAYAITTLKDEENALKHEKKAAELVKSRSKHEDRTGRINSDLPFKWLGGEEAIEDEKRTVPGSIIWHKSEEIENAAKGNYKGKMESNTFPINRKFATSTNNYQQEKAPKRLQSGKETMPRTKVTSPKKTEAFSFGNKNWEEDAKKADKIETEADAWQKAKLTKTNNRYEKMVTVISEWQTEKKAKAKHRLEKKQDGPEHKRAKALKHFNNEVSRINKIAGTARALAKEKKDNDAMKIREKAVKIRKTGKAPGACCSCF